MHGGGGAQALGWGHPPSNQPPPTSLATSLDTDSDLLPVWCRASRIPPPVPAAPCFLGKVKPNIRCVPDLSPPAPPRARCTAQHRIHAVLTESVTIFYTHTPPHQHHHQHHNHHHRTGKNRSTFDEKVACNYFDFCFGPCLN